MGHNPENKELTGEEILIFACVVMIIVVIFKSLLGFVVGLVLLRFFKGKIRFYIYLCSVIMFMVSNVFDFSYLDTLLANHTEAFGLTGIYRAIFSSENYQYKFKILSLGTFLLAVALLQYAFYTYSIFKLLFFILETEENSKESKKTSKATDSKSDYEQYVSTPAHTSHEMQLAAIQNDPWYKRKRVLNNTEFVAYHAIKKTIKDSHINNSAYLFPQISLGEVLGHHDNECRSAINSKRVDFLLVNKGFWPFAAIEIHGTGHYSGSSSHLRDEIKQTALEAAGIRYIPIVLNSTSRTHIEDTVKEVMENELPNLSPTIPKNK